MALYTYNWSIDSRRLVKGNMRKTTDYIFIHCSATRPSMDWVDAEEIDKWHRERGFFCIGYTWVIKRDGTLEKGRDLYDPTASQRGYNNNAISICMVGGVTEDDIKIAEDNYTPEQWSQLKDLLVEMKEVFPKAKIVGHNEFSSKECPSFDVQKYVKENL